MIMRPREGQAVTLHYRASLAQVTLIEGEPGRIVTVGRGPGPRNVGVKLSSGVVVVVPRGNLIMRAEFAIG